MSKIQFVCDGEREWGCLIQFVQDKPNIDGVDITSCYIAHKDNDENNKHLKSRAEYVLKITNNKFFVRMLKYV